MREATASKEGRLGERVVRFYLERVFSERNPAIMALLRTAATPE